MVCRIQTFVSMRSTEPEKTGTGTDHTKVAAQKDMAPRSLQGLQTQLERLHWRSHTDDYPLGGHCAPHLSPGPAVRHGCSHGHTWAIQGFAALISMLRWRGFGGYLGVLL